DRLSAGSGHGGSMSSAIGTSNPSHRQERAQRAVRVLSATLVTRTAALTAASAKAPVWDADAGDPFQDDVTNGRLFVRPPPDEDLELTVYGEGADDSVGAVAVWGWEPWGFPRGNASGLAGLLWVPRLLALALPVLGQRVGVADTPLGETIRFADSLGSLTDYTPSPGLKQTNDPANGAAKLLVPVSGYPVVEVELTRGSAGTPMTAIGAAWRTL
ncbi:MAG: hypothetical protein KIS87_08895, partial [Phycisphaeraceae bacterium]|nr:hypothetical protein [Phycisphaeraceae bacterium]